MGLLVLPDVALSAPLSLCEASHSQVSGDNNQHLHGSQEEKVGTPVHQIWNEVLAQVEEFMYLRVLFRTEGIAATPVVMLTLCRSVV